MRASPSPSLADLIDLEVLMARRDAGEALAVEVELDAVSADEAVPGDLAADLGLRRRAAAELLRRSRAAAAPLPGERVVRGYRAAGWLLGLLALLLGSGVARGALSFHGGDPINVWRFLGGLVLLQVALFALLIVAVAVGFGRGSSWLSGLQRGLRALSRMPWFDRLSRLTPDQAREAFRGLELARHRAATRRSLYRDAERWLLFGLAQRFGLLFNLGAAATFLALVLFTDLVFAWSTTPAEIDGSHLAALVDALAAPWAWLLPETVPGLEAIDATRWSRLDGFVGGDPEAAAAFAGGWWSFLFAALLVWGLLPRLLAWLLGGWRLRRALASVPLDDVATLALLEAALPAAAPAWSHPAPEQVAGELLAPAGGGPAAPDGSGAGATGGGPSASAACTALLWGGWTADEAAVRSLLAEPHRWSPTAVAAAGGASEDQARAALGGLASQPLVLLVEGGESPDKRLSRFLADARARLGERTLIAVTLVEPAGDGFGAVAPDDLALWRDYLARLHDPYLRVEALPA